MTPAANIPDTAPAREEEPRFPAGIRLVGSQMRSTNLERDVEEDLNAPYIGARAIDVLDRVANALSDLRRTRAWSFTGPYGSGKSTLANLIDALLGTDTHRRGEAEDLLGATSVSLRNRLAEARSERDEDGFLGAVATARREPLAATLARALHTAARRRWSDDEVPEAVAAVLAECADPHTATSSSILKAVAVLCAEHPMLLIVDEFGKTLEHIAGHGEFSSAEDDLFLLQELAEMGAGPSGHRLWLMTLQHMSFMDYAARSSELQTREWAKIQGRFEDVVFTPHLGDAVELMRRRLDHSEVSEANRARIRGRAEQSVAAWRNHGLNDVVDLTAEHFEDMYPLHPLTAIAAPYLAAQIGQHDRSLAGFLNSDEPHSVRRSLATHAHDDPPAISTIRLPQLYEFFMASGRTSLLASSNASRWIEIESRISDATGLSEKDQQVLRTVGMLNLLDSDGALRATPAMIYFALHEPCGTADPDTFDALQHQLHSLAERQFLVHRKYSDEYRVWQGTDTDIDQRVKEATAHLDTPTVIRKLGEHLPPAVIAARHSQITGMQRAFFVRATGPGDTEITGPDEIEDHADGLVIFHFGTLEDRPVVHTTLPVVLGVTEDADLLVTAATRFVAHQELLLDKSLDHVARTEIRERAAGAKAALLEQLTLAFLPPSQRATWRLWPAGISPNAHDGQVIEGRSLSALASHACDHVFHASPRIRNEMLGRHELTSQGAKTRRELLTAMLTRSGEQYLGITKYPAERALYSGVLAYMGLHRHNNALSDDTDPSSLLPYGFARPDERYPYAQPAWNALEQALTQAHTRTSLDEIFRTVMRPPYGVKAGVVPLLVVTALIIRGEDVALFEEGTYLPRLTPDIVERMVKAPYRFQVKATPLGEGVRRRIVADLTEALGAEMPRSQALRNPALLTVTRALMERMMVLSPYARRTKRLSDDAIAVRAALSSAQDPDQLLFSELPTALELPPISADAKRATQATKEYPKRLATAVEELTRADAALRHEVIQTIAGEFRLSRDLSTMRSELAERLRGFEGVELTSELRGFISIALNDSLPDEDWLDPITVRLSGSALGDWTDRDAEAFPGKVRAIARSLDRVSHLYQNRGDDALDARLLTLTSNDGGEQQTMIYLPHGVQQKAENLAVTVMKDARDQLGEDGVRILLASLAQHIAETDPGHNGKD